MSGARRGRTGARALPSVLDRLIDAEPELAQDAPVSGAQAVVELRRAVRRDLEALLNSRRRWRSWPRGMGELAVSPLNFGIPDCTGGRFHDRAQRETLRREIEDTIRRFEPRFRTLRVTLVDDPERRETTLRLRIEALLHAEPAPEDITLETVVDPVTASIAVRDV